jgi:hypothetical protein
MSLLFSIPAALLGSLLGSAARGGVAVARARVAGGPEPDIVNVSISPVAGLAGGVIGSVLGVERAFWVGAMLGAAGMDRVDAMLLSRVGIDLDALVAKATAAATQAATEAAGGAPAGEPDSAA